MSLTHRDYVEGIYQAIFFRSPTETDLAKWEEQLDLGLHTPLTLTLLGAEQPTFQQKTLPLASAFHSAFGRLMTAEEIGFWGSILNQGASLEQVATAFINSDEFKNRFEGMSLPEIYQTMTGETLSPELEATFNSRLDRPGAILLEVAEQHNSNLTIGLGLLESAFQGTSRDYETLQAIGDDAVPVLSQVLADIENSSVGGITLNDSGSTLNIAGSSTITVDLEQNRITIDGENSSVADSALAMVRDVDATAHTETPVSFIGDTENNTYKASDNGDSIQAAGGDDSIILGAGQDTVTFASSASGNGNDLMTGFTRGESGDILDFSNFLDLPSVANISTRSAAEQTAAPWSNADILVVSGQSLTSAEDIQSLFNDQNPEESGHQAVFAAPEESSKNVLISAGITGNALIWFLVNDENVNQIQSSEVNLAGSLEEVNNLTLVGFHENNFLVIE